MSFSANEREFLSRIARCVAAQFGTNCEVVIHDLEKDYEHSIIEIVNGHVTGRKVGDSGTNLGLEILRGTSSGSDKYCYITKTPKGSILRSSSVYWKDEDDKIIGSICVNYDITDLMSAGKTLAEFINLDENTEEVEEYFEGNVDTLLDHLIAEAFKQVGKSVSQMDKEDKLGALRYLDTKGAFLIKKSGDKVSRFFNMSKYTLYNYLEEIR